MIFLGGGVHLIRFDAGDGRVSASRSSRVL